MNFEDIPKMIRHLGRTLFGSAPIAPVTDLTGKTAIITGASPGSIGFETAKTLAAWGGNVIITTRSNPDATVRALVAALSLEGKSANITGHTLDLTDAQSVNSFAEWFQKNDENRLHILINNAGIHLDLLSQWKEPTRTPDGFEIHWRTNYLGSAMLTHLLLPQLKNAGAIDGDARVINVSSHLHNKGLNSELFSQQRPYDSWEAYGQSKLATVHHAFEIQRRFAQQFNVKGYVLHPGAIATNISGKGLEGTGLLQKLRNLFSPIEALILLSPTEGAQTQIYCASHPSIIGGFYYERCERGDVNTESSDTLVAERLWDETQTWIQSVCNTSETGTQQTVKL